MTPKEKTQELIKSFYPEVRWKLGQEDCLDRAKRCALITVKEILSYSKAHGFIGLTEYWEEIKQEIEKL